MPIVHATAKRNWAKRMVTPPRKKKHSCPLFLRKETRHARLKCLVTENAATPRDKRPGQRLGTSWAGGVPPVFQPQPLAAGADDCRLRFSKANVPTGDGSATAPTEQPRACQTLL